MNFEIHPALLGGMVPALEILPALRHGRVVDHPPVRPDDREDVPRIGKLVRWLHAETIDRALVEGDAKSRSFGHAHRSVPDLEWLGEQVVAVDVQAADRGPL